MTRSLLIDDDDPAAYSYPAGSDLTTTPAVIPPGTCGLSGCEKPAVWRYFTGDLAEHIARLDLCDRHAKMHDTARLQCHLCGKTMMIERREMI